MTSSPVSLVLAPGTNLVTGAQTFRGRFGSITSLELDLLEFAAGVYGTDIGILRGYGDDYPRDISLETEVSNVHAFERAREQLEFALHILTRDTWTLSFTPRQGVTEDGSEFPSAREGVVLLFSGGLDSLCAASQLLDGDIPTLFVSHKTHNQVTTRSQVELLSSLGTVYRRRLDSASFTVFGRRHGGMDFPADANRENSQRSRSFLFLTLAALSARRIGYRSIVMMAENGQFAIHLPLSAARMGPFSTHTADPEFLHIMESLLSRLLNIDGFNVTNPFLYMTKAEVVSCISGDMIHAIPKSVSCWRSARLGSIKHCGECIPCLARRIALEHNDLSSGPWNRDILTEDVLGLSAEDEGKRNLIELLEFIAPFTEIPANRNPELVEQFPELINPQIDVDQAIGMYRRFARETTAVLARYPNIQSVSR